MYVLAVTGGIGSGKTTAAAYLRDRGAVVIDLDVVAKGLLEPGMPVLEKVTEEFGPGVLGSDGRVDRAALARAAFATPERAHALDAIMHPAALAAVAGALDALALQSEPPRLVVLDIPLLAEAPAFLDLVDSVVVISSNEDARIGRAVASGMSEEEIHRRMSLQAGDAERRDIADYVIDNDGDLDHFRALLARFFEDEVAPRVA